MGPAARVGGRATRATLPRMSATRRLGLVLAALLLLAVVPWLAAPAAGPGGEPGERLVIVSPHWEGIRYEFGRAFAGWMAARGRRVEVVWVNPGGTSACLRYVKSRAAEMQGDIGIDLFFGGGVDPHLSLAEAGLLDPVTLDPAILETVPREVNGVPIYDEKAGWFGTCLTTFGIVYNKALLTRLGLQEPRSFVALGEPPYRSWVALADPRMSGTVHMIYELILQSRGWDQGFRLIARSAANARRFYHHAAEVPMEIGAGEVALGATIDSYAWAQVGQLGALSIGFVAPDGETVVNPDAIAVLKRAPHPGLAREFVEFTLSEAGQVLWMLPKGAPGGPERYVLGRMPVSPAAFAARRAEAPVTIDPFARRELAAYDTALGSRRWNLVNGLIGATLIDLHRDLTSAWAEIAAAGYPEEAVGLLTAPPCSEAEAARLAASDFSDPMKKNLRLATWSREAKERYQRARTLARRRGGDS